MQYSIRDWNKHFEVSQSRKVEGPMSWVAIPCKHDGKSFRRLMLMPGGQEIYCCWILLVQIAAKCPKRGILADDDGPLTSEDFFIKTGCPVAAFDRALKVLSEKQIGWLVSFPIATTRESSGSSLPPPTVPTIPTNQPTGPTRDVNAALTEAATDPGGRVGGNGSVHWGKVADRLASLGASRWRESIQEAKDCECTPGLALKLIDYGTSKGYGVGAIICRLAKARPTLPVEVGWPEAPKPATAVRAAPDPQAQAENRRYDIACAVKAGKLTRDKANELLGKEGLDLI